MLNALLSAGTSLLGSILNRPQGTGARDRRNLMRQRILQGEQRRYDAQVLADQRAEAVRSRAADQAFAREQAATAYRRTRELSRDQIGLIARGAREAGIHPTAALGAQPGYVGAGNPVQSITPEPRPSQPLQFVPGQPRSGSVWGDGLMQAANAFLGMERSGLENELLKAQIRQANAGTASMLAGARSRSLVDPNGPRQTGAIGGGTPYTFMGIDMDPSPWFSDAERAQTRSGEGMDWAWFVPSTLADIGYTVYNRTRRDMARRGPLPYEAQPRNRSPY